MNSSVEIIVADGGSVDETPRVAADEGAIVLRTKPGRGIQQNAGASVASGDLLVFLHADTTLPDHAFDLIKDKFSNDAVNVATFLLGYEEPSTILRFYSWFTRFDSVVTKFGDQCIVMRKEFFDEVGGFPDWPLFEDVRLLQKARLKRTIQILPARVTTSARRFTQNGVILQQIRNGWFLFLYLLGISPTALAKMYGTGNNERVKQVVSPTLPGRPLRTTRG